METALNLLDTFPAFSPYSGGSYVDLAQITINTINQSIPALRALIGSLNVRTAEVSPIASIASTDDDRMSAEKLKERLDHHGSDKASFHDYHYVYGHILKNRSEITGILEVGLGTNNPDLVSSMGSAGKPGASVRAFRDFCGHALVYGADIDRQILFEEDRIKTFFVDQTDPSSFDALAQAIPGDLDLVIDDGLHSPDANIETLKFGLGRIKVGGWVVVEDINPAAIPLWECVSAILPSHLECHILNARGGVVVAVKRLT